MSTLRLKSDNEEFKSFPRFLRDYANYLSAVEGKSEKIKSTQMTFSLSRIRASSHYTKEPFSLKNNTLPTVSSRLKRKRNGEISPLRSR